MFLMRARAKVVAVAVSLIFSSGASADDELSLHGSLSDSKSGQCTVECINPHSAPELHSPAPSAPLVLSTLQSLVSAYVKGDATAYGDLIDDDCTVVGGEKAAIVKGKSDVVALMKREFNEDTRNGTAPFASYRIEHPYVKVIGNTAVVTYHAVKKIAAQPPVEEKSSITEIFAKGESGWKLIHETGKWTTR